ACRFADPPDPPLRVRFEMASARRRSWASFDIAGARGNSTWPRHPGVAQCCSVVAALWRASRRARPTASKQARITRRARRRHGGHGEAKILALRAVLDQTPARSAKTLLLRGLRASSVPSVLFWLACLPSVERTGSLTKGSRTRGQQFATPGWRGQGELQRAPAVFRDAHDLRRSEAVSRRTLTPVVRHRVATLK